MNLKNKNYMKKEEFKARQNGFDFFCQAAVDMLESFVEECRDGWKKVFKKAQKAKKAVQLPLFMNIVQKSKIYLVRTA